MSASIADVKAAVTIPMFLESIGVQVLQAGKEQKFQALCHADKHPSGTVYQDGQAWHCFPCDKGGDVLDLVALRYPGISKGDVLKVVAEMFNVQPSITGMVVHSKTVSTATKVRASETSTSAPAKGPGTLTRYEVLPGVFHDRVDYADGTKKVTWAGLAGRKVETVPLWMHEKITPAGPVFIHEGEKSAEAGVTLGLRNSVGTYGTGATPTPDCLAFLKDRDVVLCADAHEPGRAHMRKVASNLEGIAESIRWMEFPGVPEGGDAADFQAMHGADAGRLAAELVKAAKLVEGIDAEGWPEPIPLPSVDVPQFPLDALPSVLRNYVVGLSIETQTPPDMAAMVSLGVLATASAKKAVVEVRPGWWEPVNIYSLTAMDPGNRKSPVFRDATSPLTEFEADEALRLSGEVKRAGSQRKVAEKALEHAIKQASTCAEKDRSERTLAVARLTDELAALPIVTSPRLWCDDVTQEILAVILSQNFGRLGILSAEGGLFSAIAGRYQANGAPSMEVLLKGHAGDDIAVDRVSRPAVRIHQPALTVCITVQPEVLRSCAATPEFRGRGLMARFLCSVPVSTVGRRATSPPPCPSEARHDYYAAVKRILGIESPQGEDGAPEPHNLLLANDALAEFLRFVDWLEPQLGASGELHAIADWGAKLAGAAARIAGLLHLVESSVAKPISLETMTKAIAIGLYLIPHAQAAFQLMGQDEGHEDARLVLAWIRRKQLPSFTKRDAFCAMRARFGKAEKLDRPLGVLEDHEFIRLVAEPQASRHAGRPASPRYETNPRALAHNTHNTHNSPRSDPEPSSAYSAYFAGAPASSREEADGVRMEAEPTPLPRVLEECPRCQVGWCRGECANEGASAEGGVPIFCPSCNRDTCEGCPAPERPFEP